MPFAKKCRHSPVSQGIAPFPRLRFAYDNGSNITNQKINNLCIYGMMDIILSLLCLVIVGDCFLWSVKTVSI